MRCSTGGGPSFDVNYDQADHYVCMPRGDAQAVLTRVKQCEGEE